MSEIKRVYEKPAEPQRSNAGLMNRFGTSSGVEGWIWQTKDGQTWLIPDDVARSIHLAAHESCDQPDAPYLDGVPYVPTGGEG